MGNYLGVIDIVGTQTRFVNYKPLYIYHGDQFVRLSQQDRNYLLPDSAFGNINFFSTDPAYKVADQFHDDEYVLFDFDLEDLEDNKNIYNGERNKTGYKVNILELPSGRIKTLKDIGYYQLLILNDIQGNYRTNSIINVIGTNYYVGQEVFLQVENNLILGPFSLAKRDQDNQFFFSTRLKENKYVIPGYQCVDDMQRYYKKLGTFENERIYILIDSTFTECPQDVVSTELLIQSFRDSLTTDCFVDGKLDLSDIEKLINGYSNSLLIGKGIPKRVAEQRLERLRLLLSDEVKLQDTFSSIAKTITALLFKYKETPEYSGLITTIANDMDFMLKIQSFKIITDRVQERQNEAEALKRTLDGLKAEIDKQSAQDAAAEKMAQYQTEIESKAEEKAYIEEQIKSLREKLNLFKEGETLQSKLSELSEIVSYKEKRERELDDNIRTIEARLDTKFSNSTEKAVDFAFDGMLANRMLQQAAKWENQQHDINYVATAKQMQELPHSALNHESLVAYICNKVAQYRPDYGKNAIINIMICLCQNFLTIFSGEPGTGKTSICNIVTHVLGLTLPRKIVGLSNDGFDPNRYVSVSVERGWTTKRDFIGYYNPLTKAFDKSNRRIYDAFQVLNAEAHGICSDLPFVILLDEANLSPMEYYWADFMNICDDRNDNSSINLGENYYLNIPEALRFVATINKDHTTETLSPRLIDRAWIIRLPKARSGYTREVKYDFSDIEQVSWERFVSTFGVDNDNQNSMSGEAKDIYEKIFAMFSKERATISPRTDNAIRKYWSVAQTLFENDFSYGTDASIIALDFAIAQKVLPQINGSGDNYCKFLDALKTLCSEQNLRESEDILIDIIEKGSGNMKFFSYFN